MIAKFLVIIALLSLVQVHADPLANLQAFSTDLWAQYNLPAPTTFIGCFNETEAQNQMNTITSFYPLCVAFAADAKATYSNLTNYINNIDANMERVWNCATETEDFDNFLNAINAAGVIHNTNWANFFVAHCRDLSIQWASGYTSWLAQNWENAAKSLVPIISAGVANATNYNLTAMSATVNGMFWYLNLSMPVDSVYCLSNTYIPYLNQLFGGWANAVEGASGSSTAGVATEEWWNSDGLYFYKLLNPVQQCVINSGDHARVTSALGVDINSSQFQKAWQGYYSNPNYYNQAVLVAEFWDSNQFFQAGQAFAELLQDVAQEAMIDILTA